MSWNIYIYIYYIYIYIYIYILYIYYWTLICLCSGAYRKPIFLVLHYPAHHPHPAQQKPPEGWASFRDAPLAAPDEPTATRMGLTDQETYVRSLKKSLQEAHRWHARSPSPPRGQGGSPAPDTHEAKKTKTGQGARQRARQQGATP